MRKTLPILLSASLIIMASSAYAQNTAVRIPHIKTTTSTTPNPVIVMGVNDQKSGMNIPDGNILIQPAGQQSHHAPKIHVRQEHPTGAYIHTPDTHIQMQAAAPSTRNTGMIGSGMSYANADLSGKDFSNKYLVGANFTNANISNANFSGADLRGSILVNADLTNAKFINAQMMGANFTGATFMSTNVSGSNMAKANLTNIGGENSLAIGTNFEGTTQINADMSIFITRRTQQPQLGAVQQTQPAPTVMMQQQAPTPKTLAPVQQKTKRVNQTVNPALTTASEISQKLTKAPTKSGDVKKIDLSINFDMDSDILTDAGMRQVKEVATALNSAEMQGSHIRIEGHTDNIGNADYNQELSYRRAMRVLFTLRDQHKISGSLLEAKGYGETKPLANNKSDMGRMINRRVTIVNLDK